MKVSFLLACLLLSSSAFARTVARVIDIKGNAFVFGEGRSSNSLRYGTKIPDLSEVMVEDGSALSLINNVGHVYHVSGGTLVKFYKGFAEVQNGQIWVVAKDSDYSGVLHTSNSIVKYKSGQFIYSFDNTSGKTQLLALSGDLEFSNTLEPDLTITVPAGHFSIVEQSFERGLPRTPTKVGLKSYKQFKSLFANFDSLQDSSTIEDSLWAKPVSKPKRSIASVSDQFSMKADRPKGKLIKITTYKSTGREPASISPMKYYREIKQKQSHLRKPASTGQSAQIKYFGFKFKNNPVKKTLPAAPVKKQVKKQDPVTIKTNIVNPLREVNRAPASIGAQSLVQELKGSSATSDFEKSLMQSEVQNKRHAEEVNTLIDELKSYKQDYKKNY